MFFMLSEEFVNMSFVCVVNDVLLTSKIYKHDFRKPQCDDSITIRHHNERKGRHA